MQPHRLAPLSLDEIDDEFVDLVAKDLLGEGKRPLIGISTPLHHLRNQPGRLHPLIDRLSSAVHQDRLHADVVHEDDIVEQVGEGLLIVHDRSADFDHDYFVVESLDVGEGLDQCRGFGYRRVDHR